MANFVHQQASGSSTPSVKTQSNVNGLFQRKNSLAKQNNQSTDLKDRKRFKKFNFRSVLGLFIFFLLFFGGVSAFILSQTSQDVRQQASGCTYWNGEPAIEGAFDDRGGIRQQCKNGYWSTPDDGNTNPGIADSGSSGSVGGGNSSQACSDGQIYCAGCIQGCRAPTQKCNDWIDQECKVEGCGGNGVFPAPQEQCCPGLTQCANGRCGVSCSLDNNPICGGIREGSDCNNGGRWTCDSTEGEGSGHCDGGVWNQESSNKISCSISGQIIYYETQEQCDSAKNFAENVIGGVGDFINDAAETASNLVAQATVKSESSETHSKRCDLNGTIVFVTTDQICEAYGGNPANGFVGPCCVDGEYTSLCRPEERESIPANSQDCQEKPGWVGPCCVDGEYKTLCREADRDYLPSSSSDCTASAGKGCGVNHDTQCVDGTLYECMNEEWINQGSNCAFGGPGPVSEETCYYLGANNVCTPSSFSITPGISCSSMTNFTNDSSCDDLLEAKGIVKEDRRCYYRSGTSCLSTIAQLLPEESCSDEDNNYYDNSDCGLDSSGPNSLGVYQDYNDCKADKDESPDLDFCKQVTGGYQLVEFSISLNDVAEPNMEFIPCYTDSSGCYTVDIEVEEGEICRTYGHTSEQPDNCGEMGPVEESEFSWTDPGTWFSWVRFPWTRDEGTVPGNVSTEMETIYCYTQSSGCSRAAVEVESGNTCVSAGYSINIPNNCMDTIECYTPNSGCEMVSIQVEPGHVCRTEGYTRVRPAECDVSDTSGDSDVVEREANCYFRTGDVCLGPQTVFVPGGNCSLHPSDVYDVSSNPCE